MRGKIAKLLRRVAYGDKSLRNKRRYVRGVTTGMIKNRPQGERALYLKLKAKYKREGIEDGKGYSGSSKRDST